MTFARRILLIGSLLALAAALGLIPRQVAAPDRVAPAALAVGQAVSASAQDASRL